MRRQPDLLPRLFGALSGLVILGLGLLLLCLCPGSARAQDRPTVAVLELPGSPKTQAAVSAVLRKSYTLVPPVRWNAAAKQLNATGRAADEIAMVAGELKIDAVVTFTVKKDKETRQWTLTASARNGASGKAVEKLKYPLRTQRVDLATMKKLLADIGPAVEKAIKGVQEEPLAEAPRIEEGEGPRAAPPGKEEDPLEKLRQMEEAERRKKDEQRPVWYPYIDAGVGFILGGRRLSFDEDPGTPIKCYEFDKLQPDPITGQPTRYQYAADMRCPGFKASVAGGLRFDANVFPLAGFRMNPLRGLGLGATVDVFFWPSSKTCNKRDESGTCTVAGPDLPTSEVRAELGLRWGYNVLNKRSRPSLLVMLQYGLHQFSVAKESPLLDANGKSKGADTLNDHGLPDIFYQYVDLGLGGRVPYFATERYFLGLVLDFHFHIMTSHGDIERKFIDTTNSKGMPIGGPAAFNGGYGPVSGSYGLRLDITPVEWTPWKGLTIRATGYYEMFSMAFELLSADKGYEVPPTTRGETDAARHLARGALDQYFGGVLQVGYQY